MTGGVTFLNPPHFCFESVLIVFIRMFVLVLQMSFLDLKNFSDFDAAIDL